MVDVQNDFCPGGALAVPDGDAVVEPANRLAAQSGFVIATRDWHPSDHESFAAQGGPWPVHCVAGSSGAELHAGIDRGLVDAVVDKGQARDREGYSGFEGTELERLLRDHDVDKVHVVGLALDYCVKETALDAVRKEFATEVITEATRPVDAEPGDGERALREIEQAGVELV